MKKVRFIVLSALVLSGCSRYSSSGESLYLKNHNGPKLEVPHPLTDSGISGFYNLPEQNQDVTVRIDPPLE